MAHATSAADAGPTPDRGRSSTWPRITLILVVATVVLRLPGFVLGFYDPDEAAIAVQAMAITDGGELYVDAIDRKPPLAPAVYAAAFTLTGGHDLRPPRAVVAVLMLGAALLIAWDLRRRCGDEVAVWGGVLFLTAVAALSPRDAQAANFSHLALAPGVAAVVLARSGRRGTALAAGVMVGLATLTRQTWLIGVLPAAFAAWRTAGRDLLAPLLVAVGAVVTVGSVALVVPFERFWTWTFSGNGSLLFDISSLSRAFTSGLGSLSLFLIGHLVLVALVVRRRWHGEDLDLWLWLGAGLVAVGAGARFFGHYWLQAIPPLVLLGAPAIADLRRTLKLRAAGVLAVTAVVFWVLAWMPQQIQPQPDADRLAKVIEDRTAPGERVAVWGSFPELHWRADRLPTGGLVHTDFLVGKSAGRPDDPASVADVDPEVVAEYLRAWRANPPALVIDTAPAGLRGWDAYPMTVIDELATLVAEDYTLVDVIDGIHVHAPRR